MFVDTAGKLSTGYSSNTSSQRYQQISIWSSVHLTTPFQLYVLFACNDRRTLDYIRCWIEVFVNLKITEWFERYSYRAMRYTSFHKTSNFQIQIYTNDISPPLHVSAAGIHLQGTTPVNCDTVCGVNVHTVIIKS